MRNRRIVSVLHSIEGGGERVMGGGRSLFYSLNMVYLNSFSSFLSKPHSRKKSLITIPEPGKRESAEVDPISWTILRDL
jgi:hypothetical protein